MRHEGSAQGTRDTAAPLVVDGYHSRLAGALRQRRRSGAFELQRRPAAQARRRKTDQGAQGCRCAFSPSGPGRPVRRHGQGPGRGFPGARRDSQEVDDALGESLSKVVWEGPEVPDADGQRAAGTDSGLAGHPCGALEARAFAGRQGRVYRRSFARRIFNARRRRHPLRSPMPRGCCAFAATPCSWLPRSAPAPSQRSSARPGRRGSGLR